MTGPALALLETKTHARGLEALDAMLKEAPVTIVATRAIEPGRYLILVAGEVDDARTSLRRGHAVAAEDFHDELFLPGPHPALLAALEPVPAPLPAEPAHVALGLVECASVATTLLAADAAVKQAAVRLLAVRIGADMHGKGLVALRGEPADVESAVSRAASLAEERGMLVRASVVPRAGPRVLEAAARRA